MAVDILFTVVEAIGTVIQKIHERFQQLELNDDYRLQIMRNVQELRKFSIELQNLDSSDVSDMMQEKLVKVNGDLSQITATCKLMKSENFFEKYVGVFSEGGELVQLDTKLKQACENLKLTLQLACYNQGRQIKGDIKRESQEVKNLVQHSAAGVYINPNGKCPQPVQNLKVSSVSQNELVEIEWTDRNNDIKNLDRYELEFDDETSKTIPIPLSEYNGEKSIYSVRLGEPQLKAGRIYTIKVRAANGSGPGPWSNSLNFCFRSGPPERPKKPKVNAISATSVAVDVTLLSKDDERGSPVTTCQIEYLKIDETVASQWTSSRRTLKDLSASQFVVDDMKPLTTYKFRVKMINQFGTSQPSEASLVLTNCQIPGPPTNVRLSSKRTSKTLKLRWNPPTSNPEVVMTYVVHYRRSKKDQWETMSHRSSTKHSQKFTGLKTDTKYDFRIQAFNENNQGGLSDIVQGETRCGALGRGAATGAALVGGTVGGPLIGSVGLGAMAAEEAGGKKAGKVAAGTAAGVGGFVLGLVGAPVFGIASAVAVNMAMSGSRNLDSPQTSDDEDK